MTKIEKGIPIPPKKYGATRQSAYPWRQLAPGDSFFVPGASKKFASSVSQAAKRYGLKLTSRGVDGGMRVWRLPDDGDPA